MNDSAASTSSEISSAENASAFLWFSLWCSGGDYAPAIQSRSTKVSEVLARSLTMTWPPGFPSFHAWTAETAELARNRVISAGTDIEMKQSRHIFILMNLINRDSPQTPSVKAQRSRPKLSNQQRATEHCDVLHEHDHLDLRHHWIADTPELVHHEGNGN